MTIETRTCAHCGTVHQRKRFCSNTCKDRFHNRHNPRGYGAVSVSPATDPTALWEWKEKMHAEAMEVATNGWDEGGWRRDDSGVMPL